MAYVSDFSFMSETWFLRIAALRAHGLLGERENGLLIFIMVWDTLIRTIL